MVDQRQRWDQFSIFCEVSFEGGRSSAQSSFKIAAPTQERIVCCSAEAKKGTLSVGPQRAPNAIAARWSSLLSRSKTSQASSRGVSRSSIWKFFWGAVSINFEKRCNHYRLILACMLSGVSRDRPVIVGWSTAPRGQVIEESLGQLPKKLAAGPRVLARTESLRTQSGTKQGGPPHDHWAKLGQLRYTRSQYAFVVIALFSMKFIAPPSRKKG